ncbi:MAG: hypothetical protein ACJ736_13355 [Streptomyces sp.]
MAQCPHGGRHLGRAVADRDGDDGSAEPGGVVDLDDAVGDPRATRDAILRIADAERPPLRIFLGKSFTDVATLYEERLSTWRRWQPVSLAAFG